MIAELHGEWPKLSHRAPQLEAPNRRCLLAYQLHDALAAWRTACVDKQTARPRCAGSVAARPYDDFADGAHSDDCIAPNGRQTGTTGSLWPSGLIVANVPSLRISGVRQLFHWVYLRSCRSIAAMRSLRRFQSLIVAGLSGVRSRGSLRNGCNPRLNGAPAACRRTDPQILMWLSCRSSTGGAESTRLVA